jgi:hypothetical protein
MQILTKKILFSTKKFAKINDLSDLRYTFLSNNRKKDTTHGIYSPAG